MAVKKTETETKSAELVTKLSDEALSGITSFDDALRLLQETYGADSVAIASDVLGDGFALLDNNDKHKLVGEGFILVNWDFHMGDHGEFVAARLVTANNKKMVLIDGSTGICKQLSLYTANTGKSAGLYVAKGLRRSDYTYDDNGTEKAATTYYLDVSA